MPIEQINSIDPLPPGYSFSSYFSEDSVIDDTNGVEYWKKHLNVCVLDNHGDSIPKLWVEIHTKGELMYKLQYLSTRANDYHRMQLDATEFEQSVRTLEATHGINLNIAT